MNVIVGFEWRDILKDFAASEPVDGSGDCTICDWPRPSEHAESCPWRRAVEWLQANETWDEMNDAELQAALRLVEQQYESQTYATDPFGYQTTYLGMQASAIRGEIAKRQNI